MQKRPDGLIALAIVLAGALDALSTHTFVIENWPA
jgi:hypothetical protein